MPATMKAAATMIASPAVFSAVSHARLTKARPAITMQAIRVFRKDVPIVTSLVLPKRRRSKSPWPRGHLRLTGLGTSWLQSAQIHIVPDHSAFPAAQRPCFREARASGPERAGGNQKGRAAEHYSIA